MAQAREGKLRVLATLMPERREHLLRLVDRDPAIRGAQRRQRLLQERRVQAETALRQDPVVKAVMTTFDAVLVPESLTLPH